jgi:hypothetical protein
MEFAKPVLNSSPSVRTWAIGSCVTLSDGQSREEMIKLGLQRDVALGLQVE